MIRGLHIYLTLYFMNIITHQPPRLPLFPYTTLFRSPPALALFGMKLRREDHAALDGGGKAHPVVAPRRGDRKSTRLNSSHANISYAVFCLKKKTQNIKLM